MCQELYVEWDAEKEQDTMYISPKVTMHKAFISWFLYVPAWVHNSMFAGEEG